MILGAHNISKVEPTQVRQTAVQFISHPDFNLTAISDDIGLIKLSVPVTENLYISVIKLATGERTYAGSLGMFTNDVT